jgi:hypothetical protein
MALIKFTRNYRDDSTDRGFQFEFYYDRCGAGITPGARFCGECSQPIKIEGTPKFCPECGAKM